MRLAAFALIVSTALSGAALLPQRVQVGTVRGVVLDAENLRPVASAHVRVLNTKLSGATDSAGRFEFTAVPMNQRRIEVTKERFRAAGVRAQESTRTVAICTLFLAEPLPGTRARITIPGAVRIAPMVIVDAVIRPSVVPDRSTFELRGDSLIMLSPALPAVPRTNIETLEIVQPAAAKKLYGERGAAGVIVMTTRPQVRC